MNTGLKRIATCGVAALTLAGSVAASSGTASARPLYHGYHHYGYHHGYHHYGYGGGAFPGLIAGLIGGIAVAALSHHSYYDDYGPYYYGGYPGYDYGYAPSYSYGYGYGAPYRYGFRRGGWGGHEYRHAFGGFHSRPGGFRHSFAAAGGHRGGGAVLWHHR